MTEKVKILSAGAISAMLKRMAFEIYERNFAAEKLVVTGIGPRGGFLADILQGHLQKISPLKLHRQDLQKLADGLAWIAQPDAAEIADSTLVLVDDVLYSGSTVVQALILAAELGPDKIQTAVLIDRGHHRFPVQANYVGMEIATSLKQYVNVEVDVATERAEAFIF